MKIECPSCSATGNVDGSRVPKEGRHVTCPRCKNRFLVLPERSAVEIIQKREAMACPKCGAEQPVAQTCGFCGIVVQKYIQSVDRQREAERLEFVKLRSDMRRVDSWYSDLFDRRLSTLVLRVLSLLVFVWLSMTCSMNSARKSRIEAHNAAEQRRAEEGPVRPPPDDGKIIAQLKTFEAHVKDAAYQCINQCDRYSLAWYDKAEPGMNMYRDHTLSDGMEEALSALRAVKRTIDADFRGLGTPSKPYWPYYYKVKGLYNCYNSLYDLANTPDTHYYDFRGVVSRNEGDLRRTLSELDQVRPQ